MHSVIKIIWLLFSVLRTGQSSSLSRDSSALYRTFYFDDFCPVDSSKREINLRTGAAAIFKFDESNLKTKQFLREKEISCHIELETDSGYGFHVYIEEMNLDTSDSSASLLPPKVDSSSSSTQTSCRDFLQFGRDVLVFTTHASQKYCGQFSRIQYGRNASDTLHNSQLATSLKQGNRFYIEEKDNEMDLWLKVYKSDGNKKRSLTLVVTTFKKSCINNDIAYRQCSFTKSCIRRDLFCDGIVNCAWPSGDTATDELNCEGFYAGYADLSSSSTSSNEIFQSTNIPVIIIVVLVIVGLTVAATFTVRRIIHSLKQTPRPIQDRTCSAPMARSDLPSEITETTPALQHRDDNDADNRYLHLTAPPSYEEALKSVRPASMSLEPHIIEPPPPYTPSAPPLPEEPAYSYSRPV